MSQPRRQMLPAELLGMPGARRSARDWLVDVTLFVFALGLGIFVAGAAENAHTDGLWALDVLGGLASAIAIWWRRPHPGRVAAIAIGASTFSGFAGGFALVALFNLAIRGTRRQIAWASAATLVSAAGFGLIYPDPDTPLVLEIALGALFLVLAVGWGLFVRAQRDLVQTLHQRAEQAEAEQRLREERARDAERRRIAGEMHDVLAHRISLLTVHAGALEFNPDPAHVAEAAGVIRATAAAALDDLREVIGLLREDTANGAPQPTLDAIPALVDESRAAGMNVTARIDAAGGDVIIGRTAYRVVQEGLTNARKHAPAARVDVSVSAGDALLVQVVSRGRPGPEQPGTGTGLIGLAERVALAGGELRHGPDARGDFVLSATLPWP
jgi:signal transduction histidine kinase